MASSWHPPTQASFLKISYFGLVYLYSSFNHWNYCSSFKVIVGMSVVSPRLGHWVLYGGLSRQCLGGETLFSLPNYWSKKAGILFRTHGSYNIFFSLSLTFLSHFNGPWVDSNYSMFNRQFVLVREFFICINTEHGVWAPKRFIPVFHFV